MGSKVIFHTNHSALKYILIKKDTKPRFIKWIKLLQDFDLQIVDRNGTKNQVVDHLSRLKGKVKESNEVRDAFINEQLG